MSDPAPVDRRTVFRSRLVEIRDNICARDRSGPSPPTAPLPFHEVCLPRRGVWIRHLHGRDLPVESSTAHLLNRGEVHRVSHPSGCGDRNTGLLVADGVLTELAVEVDPAAAERPERPFDRTHAPLDRRTWARHAALLAGARRATADRAIEIEERALELVARVLRSGRRPASPDPSSRTRRRHRELAGQARTVLAAHHAEPLSLASVAEAVGVSPWHLARVFRRETGSSIHGALVEFRLRAALERLVEGDEPLADVAARCGFADRTCLSRAFRRAFGAPPSQIRRADALALAKQL